MADEIYDEEELLEQYSELKKDVLREKNHILVKDLQPFRLLPYLRSQRLFDEDDEEIIKAEITNKRKAQMFLDILLKKGPDAFDKFCRALLTEATGQQHLLRIILEEFDLKRVGALEPVQIRRPKPVTVVVLPKPGDVGFPMLPTMSDPPPAYTEYSTM